MNHAGLFDAGGIAFLKMKHLWYLSLTIVGHKILLAMSWQ
jgi:hypothetical protein